MYLPTGSLLSPSMRSSLFGRLFALFLFVPIAELFLLVWLGDRVGIAPTLGLIVATALTGAALAKREGLAALRRFQERLASGGLPGKELTDGLIILVAGALLLTPGLLTDVVGFLGLLPPTRSWIRTHLQARVQKALTRSTAGAFAAHTPDSAAPPSIEDATVIFEEEHPS